jgi:hypothetical protein
MPIRQIITLLAAATTHPCHMRRETRIVDRMVSTQDR